MAAQHDPSRVPLLRDGGRQAHRLSTVDDLRAMADTRHHHDTVIGISMAFKQATRVAHDMSAYGPAVMALSCNNGDTGKRVGDVLLITSRRLRDTGTRKALQEVMDAGHVAVHGLRHLAWMLAPVGLRVPTGTTCTHLMATLLDLGLHHVDHDGDPLDDLEEIKKSRRRPREQAASIQKLVNRFKLRMDIPSATEHLGHLTDQVFIDATPDWVRVNHELTAKATATARLCTVLQSELMKKGVYEHYTTIELPAAMTLARMEVSGIPIDVPLARRARLACRKASDEACRQLETMGFCNPDDDVECVRALRARGLEVPATLKFTVLRDLARADEVANLIWRHRLYGTSMVNTLERCLHVDRKGRVHPTFSPLGADTGRITSSNPNLMGIDRVLRPVGTTDGPEYGIAELDVRAQEIGLVAEIYDDTRLRDDCNTGDVYARVAEELVAPMLGLDQDDCNAAEPGNLRDRAKLLFLAVLYGAGDTTVAQWMGTDRHNAQKLKSLLFQRYPDLKRNMDMQAARVLELGYASSVTGLRRYRNRTGELIYWEQCWAKNTPIQSSGASWLKLLIPRLESLLEQHGGRVLLTVHDSVVIQYRLENPDVVEAARDLMETTLNELFPRLNPKVEINMSDPTCWNRKGLGDSIERLLKDPMFTC